MRLHIEAAAAGHRLLAQETLSSTNTEALRLARGGERGPLWITARRQTAGRGRRGNEWISPPGNLYATLLLSDPSPAERSPELTFVAGLAVHDAIADLAPGLRPKLKLKWPNDVLCSGAKLAGILIESEAIEGRLAAAIGTGINCRHHPMHTAYPTADLAAAGADVSAEELFEALSRTTLQRLVQWCRSGFASVRADWLLRAAALGAEVCVRLPDREFFGGWEGLDERGRLLLRLRNGSLQAIAAGDVFPVHGSRAVDTPASEQTE